MPSPFSNAPSPRSIEAAKTTQTPDGRIGPATLSALDSFLAARGRTGGETVLLRALDALQGERYLRLAERRPANEAFLYGWLANRIGEP